MPACMLDGVWRSKLGNYSYTLPLACNVKESIPNQMASSQCILEVCEGNWFYNIINMKKSLINGLCGLSTFPAIDSMS